MFLRVFKRQLIKLKLLNFRRRSFRKTAS